MALELRSQLCTFENSTNCNEISFDPHSFSEELKGLLVARFWVKKCLNTAGRGTLSQSRMHIFKNFPHVLPSDPIISISLVISA